MILQVPGAAGRAQTQHGAWGRVETPKMLLLTPSGKVQELRTKIAIAASFKIARKKK